MFQHWDTSGHFGPSSYMLVYTWIRKQREGERERERESEMLLTAKGSPQAPGTE